VNPYLDACTAQQRIDVGTFARSALIGLNHPLVLAWKGFLEISESPGRDSWRFRNLSV
jgi:hypothetical protein